MAIVNPRNLYSGNSGIFNSNPYTNFAINQMAMRKAKDESLDNYFSEQGAKINAKGLAPSEVQALMQEKENFQNDYQKNKQKIHQNDPEALTNIYQHLNKMNEIVSRGQEKTAQLTQLNKARLVPGVSDLFNKDAMDQTQSLNAPIYKVNTDGTLSDNNYDPVSNATGFKPFDFSHPLFHPKPYDSKEMGAISSAAMKGVDKDAKVSVKYTPTSDKYTNLQTITKIPTDNAIKQVGDKARDAALKDPKLTFTVGQSNPFGTMKKEHEDDFNELNGIFKKMYGKDINGNEDLYAAEQMKMASQPIVESKSVKNEAQYLKDAFAKQRNSDALIRGREKANSGTTPYDSWAPIANNPIISTGVVDNDKVNWQNGKMITTIQDPKSVSALYQLAKSVNPFVQSNDLFYVPGQNGNINLRDKSDPKFIMAVTPQSVLMQTAKELGTGAATKKDILNTPNSKNQTQPKKNNNKKVKGTKNKLY